jgi:hypothetical protein
MKLQRAAALAAALLLSLGANVLAAEGATPPVDAPASGDGAAAPSYLDSVNPYLPGEQTIGLSIGGLVPVLLEPVTGAGVSNLYFGGDFSFSYQYFVARGFAVGGHLAGAFNSTIGGLSVFTAPLTATAAYWWAKLPFEFQLFGEGGAYLMRYNSKGIIDPFARAGAGVYYRIDPSWSLGLQSSFWFVPELHYGSYSSLTQYAGLVDASICAFYHL